MPSLTRSCLALPVPALICDSLSVPKLALHYPAWLCTVQYCPSRHPCPVLLTMPDPVTFCPALFNTGRPFVALPGPSRSRLVLTELLCFTLPGAVLPDTAQLGHGRPCTNMPSSALRCQFCHDPPSLVLSYPAWPCTALHCPSCPCPVLLPTPGLVQPHGTR